MPRYLWPTLGAAMLATLPGPGLALPDPAEVPEEVLRTEVITEARSPLDGQPLSAAEYAALQEQLRDLNIDAIANSDVAQLIQLLQIRRVVRPVLPFLP